MNPFADSPLLFSLDLAARRYGCRPSELLRGSGSDLLFDLMVATRAAEEELRAQKQSVSQSISAKRRFWPKEFRRQLA